MIESIYILSGIVLLFLGGKILLKGCISLAHSFCVSKLLISAVIIGFGTSIPELSVSISAAMKNSPDIVLGNIIGSNIANILVVIGISALITPIFATNSMIFRDILVLIFSNILLIIIMWFNILNFITGICFLLILITYIIYSFLDDRKNFKKDTSYSSNLDSQKLLKPLFAFIISILGLFFLVGGSVLLVEGAISVARMYGLSEAIIGLTIIAFASSLPELVTAVISSSKKHGEIVLGSIIGTNIFNILAILAITVIIQPISVSQHLMYIDVWVMFAALILLSFLVIKKIKIGTNIGILMIISYISYFICLYN